MTDLTDRYVYSVVRSVAPNQRQEVADELRASIADAIDGHVAAGVSAQEAETEVLTELGAPSALAEQYGGRPRYLIGPDYYDDFVQLLRVLLGIVVPILGVITLFSSAQSGAGALDTFVSTVGAMVYGGIQLAFWVTAVFALLERFQTPVRSRGWALSDLPPLPERSVGRADTVWSIALLSWMLFALFWQREHWLVGGEPVLNPDLWSFWLPVAAVVVVLNIVLEVAKYRSGQWTVRLAIANTLLNIAFAGIVIGLWAGPGLLNPAMTAGLPEGLVAMLNLIPWGVAFVCLLDTAEGWWKALRR